MVNVEKQVEYWVTGAREDWDVAQMILKNKRTRQALFFAHLALEKALKAHVTRHTKDIPPRIHDLASLAKRSGLTLEPAQRDLLHDVGDFNILGRYPEQMDPPPPLKEARNHMRQMKEMLEWLLSTF